MDLPLGDSDEEPTIARFCEVLKDVQGCQIGRPSLNITEEFVLGSVFVESAEDLAELHVCALSLDRSRSFCLSVL